MYANFQKMTEMATAIIKVKLTIIWFKIIMIWLKVLIKICYKPSVIFAFIKHI